MHTNVIIIKFYMVWLNSSRTVSIKLMEDTYKLMARPPHPPETNVPTYQNLHGSRKLKFTYVKRKTTSSGTIQTDHTIRVYKKALKICNSVRM